MKVKAFLFPKFKFHYMKSLSLLILESGVTVYSIDSEKDEWNWLPMNIYSTAQVSSNSLDLSVNDSLH